VKIKCVGIIAAVGLVVSLSQNANADSLVLHTLTYDDVGVPNSQVLPGLNTPPGAGFVEDGFKFSNNMAVFDIGGAGINPDHTLHFPTQYADKGPAVSGFDVAVNFWGGGPITITRNDGGEFEFNTTSLKSWAGDTVTGTISGYLDGILVGQAQYSVSSSWIAIPAWALGPGEMDQLVITLSDPNQFVMIDSTRMFELVTDAVPEPSTWAMMILGFAGIGFMTYRRKSKPGIDRRVIN
jgi:hypothetical protein